MRRRPLVQRAAGPAAIEIAPASLYEALKAIDVARTTGDLQLDFQQPRVQIEFFNRIGRDCEFAARPGSSPSA